MSWDKAAWFDQIVDWMRRRGVSEFDDGPVHIVLGPEPRMDLPDTEAPAVYDPRDDLFNASPSAPGPSLMPARKRKAA